MWPFRMLVCQLRVVLDITRLKPIKEQLPDDVTYGHINLALALLKLKYGVTDGDFLAPAMNDSSVTSVSAPSATATSVRVPSSSVSSDSGSVIVQSVNVPSGSAPSASQLTRTASVSSWSDIFTCSDRTIA